MPCVGSGGGGYGNPRERDPALIEEDLRDGYISQESARQNYGYTRPDGGRSG